MNFTFPQNYNIWQLLTLGHDCPVPADKHDSDKNVLQPPGQFPVDTNYKKLKNSVEWSRVISCSCLMIWKK